MPSFMCDGCHPFPSLVVHFIQVDDNIKYVTLSLELQTLMGTVVLRGAHLMLAFSLRLSTGSANLAGKCLTAVVDQALSFRRDTLRCRAFCIDLKLGLFSISRICCWIERDPTKWWIRFCSFSQFLSRCCGCQGSGWRCRRRNCHPQCWCLDWYCWPTFWWSQGLFTMWLWSRRGSGADKILSPELCGQSCFFRAVWTASTLLKAFHRVSCSFLAAWALWCWILLLIRPELGVCAFHVLPPASPLWP